MGGGGGGGGGVTGADGRKGPQYHHVPASCFFAHMEAADRGHKLLKRNLFAKLKIFAAICFDLYTIGVVYILGNDKFLN